MTKFDEIVALGRSTGWFNVNMFDSRPGMCVCMHTHYHNDCNDCDHHYHCTLLIKEEQWKILPVVGKQV